MDVQKQMLKKKMYITMYVFITRSKQNTIPLFVVSEISIYVDRCIQKETETVIPLEQGSGQKSLRENVIPHLTTSGFETIYSVNKVTVFSKYRC